MESNYEKTKRKMQDEFLKYDQRKMIERFRLESDERYLSFPFMGSPCRIERSTGGVECFRGGQFREGSFNEAMTVYDLLCWSKPDASPAGEYVMVQNLSPLHSASKGLGTDGFLSREAKLFDHRDEELRAALHNAGGHAASGGDIAALFNAFRDLTVIFRFWDSDEDFGPQIQLFWDRNVLQYMHFETVWYAGGVLISRIREEMSR